MTLQRKPEHSFQAWLHKFLEAVVLEPRDIRGFDKAGSVRSAQGWGASIARGILDGTPDHQVLQGPDRRHAVFELKSKDGKARDAQIATADAYEACGVTVVRDCRIIAAALAGLRAAGIRLSANADTVARVYQEHVDASERARAAAAPVKRAASKPRAPRVSAAQIKRGHKVGLWRT